MPEDLHGWYCATCCPACKAQAIPQQPPVMETEPEPQPVETVQAA